MAKVGPIAKLDSELTYGKFLSVVIIAATACMGFVLRTQFAIMELSEQVRVLQKASDERYLENRDWRIRTEERLKGIEGAVRDLPNHTFTVRNEK